MEPTEAASGQEQRAGRPVPVPWRRTLEVPTVVLVFGIALVVRIARLGTVPDVVTADEADNLQTAYHIIEGTGPGFFGFDWKPAPAFSMYNLAWTIELFGNSIVAFRLLPVILSLLTIGGFYLVARRAMGVLAASAAMALLATNLLFLHFSRTAWENVNAPLFAIGACYTTQRALEHRNGRPWVLWWAGTGVFVTLGLYGYFTGRFIFPAVTLIAVFAVAACDAPWRSALAGLGVAGLVSMVLFSPMAVEIVRNWDHFTNRTDLVSVFGLPDGQTYEGDSNGWVIAGKNVVRNSKAFLLHDGSEMNRGLWSRYNPGSRAPLGFIAKHFFWGGLVIAAVVWRKAYAWWPFFVPLFIVEVFSTGTPDVARGIIILPFYFLFIGLFFDALQNAFTSRRAQALAGGAIVGVVMLIGTMDVVDYFEWQENPDTQLGRLPGVAACEFELWSGMARGLASEGSGLVDPGEFDRLRRELACSDLIDQWLPPLPS